MKKPLFALLKIVFGFFIKCGFGKMPGASMIYLNVYKPAYKMLMPKDEYMLVDCLGNKMFVDTKDDGLTPSLLTQGIFERKETEIFISLLKPGMTILDIGANIGYYTLIAAKVIGEKGKIFSVEPEPHNYGLLCKNVNINKYNNVTAINKAISDREGKIKLFLDGNNFGCHSLSISNVKNNMKCVEVECTTLDTLCRENLISCIDLIKVDVEGAEGHVFRKADTVLKQKNLKIFMEFYPDKLENMGMDSAGLLDKLMGYGFRVKMIDEINESIEMLDRDTIIGKCRDPGNPNGFVNLLFEK